MTAGRVKIQQFLTGFAWGSVNRRILNATLAVATITALVKIAALGKEIIVAARFGTGDDLDAFNVALIIPFALINIVATSYQTAFIPVYIQVQQRDGSAAAQQLFSSAVLLMAAIFLVIAAAMILGGEIYLPLLAGGFTANKLSLTFQLLLIIAPLILLAGINGLWSAVLNAEDRFGLVAAVPLATTIITITLLFLFPRSGIYLLAAALSLGALMELLIIGFALKKRGIALPSKGSFGNPELKKITRQAFSLLAGNLLMSGIGIIGVLMAARLASGSVASLGYANKLIALPSGLAANALGIALVPYFSRMRANEDWGQIRQTLKQYLQLTFILTVPLTILLLLLAEPLTKFLFEHGAFKTDAVKIVSTLLFYFSLQLPFYVAGVLVARLLLALQGHLEILFVSGVNLVLNIILNYFLIRKIGVAGIALATSLTYFFSFILLYSLARKKIRA